MRSFVVALALLCCGCGSLFNGVGQNTAAGAITAATDADSQKKIDNVVTEATKAARDEALGPNTDAALQKLIADTDVKLQAIVTETGKSAQGQLDGMTASLQQRVQKTIRLTIDEALGATTIAEADALREELVGTPLQKDVDALIDSAAPHINQVVQQAVQQAVQTSIAPIKTTADAEAAKWEPIAIGFAVGAALLIVCCVILVHVLRAHRQVIDKLMAQR